MLGLLTDIMLGLLTDRKECSNVVPCLTVHGVPTDVKEVQKMKLRVNPVIGVPFVSK